MPVLRLSVAIVLLSIGVCRAEPDPYREGMASRAFLFNVGQWTAVGGLVVLGAGLANLGDEKAPYALDYGFAAFTGGEILMGIQTSRMVRLAMREGIAGEPPMGGWAPFAFGKGLEGLGLLMVVIQGFKDVGSVFSGTEADQTMGRWSIAPLGAGLALDLFSWYRFGRVRSWALETAPPRLSFAPVLFRGEGKSLLPGAAMRLGF